MNDKKKVLAAIELFGDVPTMTTHDVCSLLRLRISDIESTGLSQDLIKELNEPIKSTLAAIRMVSDATTKSRASLAELKEWAEK